MKSIAFVISDISLSGGTERAVVNLSNGLSDCGYTVRIISVAPLKSPISFFELNIGVIVDSLNISTRTSCKISKVLWLIELRSKILQYVNGNLIDVIIGTSNNISTCLSLTINKRLRKYACEHVNYDTIPRFSQLLMRLTYGYLSGVICLSEIAKDKLVSLNNNVSIIPNTIGKLPVINNNTSNNQIIMVGRITQVKGYERAIDMISKLKDEINDVIVNIYGDGEAQYIESLKSKVRKMNLDTTIKINGSTKNINDVYSRSSLLLMSSYSEAFPMVLLEAMSYGIPVVAYECEGVNAIVTDGYNGYVIGNDDITDFVYKVKQILSNYNLKMNMSQNARKYSSQFSSDVIEKWVKLLEINEDTTN